MKKILIYIGLMVSMVTGFSQNVKISQMPNYTGLCDSCLVPVVIGGINYGIYGKDFKQIGSGMKNAVVGGPLFVGTGGTLQQSPLWTIDSAHTRVFYGTNINSVNQTGTINLDSARSNSCNLSAYGSCAIGIINAGITLSNSTDSTTHTLARLYWSDIPASNGIFEITTEPSSNSRPIRFTGVGRSFTIGGGGLGGTMQANAGVGGTTGGGGFGLLGVMTHSAGVYSGFANLMEINQTGTAGWRGLWIAPFVAGSGSGVHLLADFGTTTAVSGGGVYTSVFSIDQTGVIKAPLTPVSSGVGTYNVLVMRAGGTIEQLNAGSLAGGIDTVYTANPGASGLGLIYSGNDSIYAKRLVAGSGVTLTQNSDSSITIAATPAATEDPIILAYNALGSVIKAQTLDVDRATTTVTLTSGNLYLQKVYLATAQTITGIKWIQNVQGVYTGDASNVVGLYTYSAGTYTKVAGSTDDATIWKTALNTLGNKAFSSTYVASPGTYFIAILYHTSAQTTAPTIYAAANAQATVSHKLDFTNSASLGGSVATQTSLPGTQAASGVSVTQTNLWLALY